jgi:ubiquitin-conjugating enzyme E2 S
MKELQDLIKNPADGIVVVMPEHDVTNLFADIAGPVGTPYEGGVFRVKLSFGPDFPTAPPKGLILNKIYHPNISKTGDICVNTLKRDWSPEHTIRHVLQVIRCLLIEPFPESALNEEAAKMLLEDYEGYARHARLMTSIHAIPKKAEGVAEATTAASGGAGVGAVAEKAKEEKAKEKEKSKKNLRRL